MKKLILAIMLAFIGFGCVETKEVPVDADLYSLPFLNMQGNYIGHVFIEQTQNGVTENVDFMSSFPIGHGPGAVSEWYGLVAGGTPEGLIFGSYLNDETDVEGNYGVVIEIDGSALPHWACLNLVYTIYNPNSSTKILRVIEVKDIIPHEDYEVNPEASSYWVKSVKVTRYLLDKKVGTDEALTMEWLLAL